MKTVIVGGVAGGATAAARLRRLDGDMEIVLLERGPYISYANCGLPYHVSGVIADREQLLVTKEEVMRERYDVDVRSQNEVLKINPEEKTVEVKNLKTGETYKESYDNLVLSTGSSPLRPPIPGIDSPAVRSLWTIPDMDEIKRMIAENNVRTAAVVGGGFIGVEMAENLHELGIRVTIIEKQEQVMGNLDLEMAKILHKDMNDSGVNLFLGKGVEKFQPEGEKGEKVRVFLDDGTSYQWDLVILAIGVRPNSQLAEDAGIALNQRGGIIVDEYMRTGVDGIYAAGDVVQIKHAVDGSDAMIPLAGPANKQGRDLADVIAGTMTPYCGTMGTSVAKVFNLSAAATGYNEKQLKMKGMELHRDYETVMIHQKSHAGYYPGATPLFIKVIYDKNGKILGAQAVGHDGADKRIDVIATAMKLGAKVTDLAQLELAYAPPFSSAKDPVNMAGYVAENIITGKVKFMSVQEYDQVKDKVVTLDVTEPAEREIKKIEGSVHIPFGQLRARKDELNREDTIVIYCGMGVRAYNCARILMMAGFSDVYVLAGGLALYGMWKAEMAVYPVEPAEDCGSAGGNGTAGGGISGAEDELEGLQAIPVDCNGLQCPGPIMKVNTTMKELEPGKVIKVSSTDMGFASDIKAWCEKTGNELVKQEKDGVNSISYIRKNGEDNVPEEKRLGESTAAHDEKGQTMVVFSGDLDKVLASFIIANGAAALGKEVTMFFTFWGLNALRKSGNVPVKKSFIEKMFGMMMPKGSTKLRLSKMNMAGMGTKMMKKVMKDKNVDSLEDLMKAAMENGVKIVACTMSMDVMGIRKEELIDGIEFAGVASYLGDAYDSQVNLFI